MFLRRRFTSSRSPGVPSFLKQPIKAEIPSRRAGKKGVKFQVTITTREDDSFGYPVLERRYGYKNEKPFLRPAPLLKIDLASDGVLLGQYEGRIHSFDYHAPRSFAPIDQPSSVTISFFARARGRFGRLKPGLAGALHVDQHGKLESVSLYGSVIGYN